ncbi:ABC transporter transmembrane region 2-domain-containing protein [Lentinula raphanica]|nr:ABC transporter transmembrane region 2-domain-containing protein [Lentinula raphanica]
MHSSLLMARTAISLYVAALDGKIVASLVRAKSGELALNIIRWLLVAIPATWTNSWLSYIHNKLAIAYRTRLTSLVMKEYLGGRNEVGPEGKVYYKLSNLDDRIKNPDQMITHDVQRFSASLSAIYSNLAKPVLDIILYNSQLSQNVGAEGLIGLTILVQLSAALRALRHSHSRLAEFVEEIAFMRGEETEKILIEREYATVILHERKVLRWRWWFECVEEGIVKWLWGSFGGDEPKVPDLQVQVIKTLIKHLDLLTRQCFTDAFGRVTYLYKDLSELAGYTARVSALSETMEDIKKGKFEKALVSSASTEENAKILQGRGEVILSEDIQFENVPIVTPNGDILVRSLSFKI